MRNYDMEYIRKLSIELDMHGRLCITPMDRGYIELLIQLYPQHIPDKLYVYLSMEGFC
jgi:hypothetical protein